MPQQGSNPSHVSVMQSQLSILVRTVGVSGISATSAGSFAKLTTQHHVCLYLAIKPMNLISIRRRGKKFFLFFKVPDGFGAHQPSCSVDIWVFSPTAKRPGCEADHFHPIPKLRISGTIPPSLYTLLTYRGEILFLILLGLFSDVF